MDPSHALPMLLGAAWLTPLAAFCIIVLFGPKMGHHGKGGGYLSVAAIVTSCVLSFIAMFGVWLPNHPLGAAAHHGAGHEEGAEGAEHATEKASAGSNEAAAAVLPSGARFTLAAFQPAEAEPPAGAG